MENRELINYEHEQQDINQEEEKEEHYFMKLSRCEIPMHMILLELSLVDQVKFASTNSKIQECAKLHSQMLRGIDERSCFNLDVFPIIPIAKEEIDTVHRTFKDLKKLKIDMSFANDNFLDEIRVFKNLEKISIYMGIGDTNYNQYGAYLKSVTVKAKFIFADTDVIWSLMKQIKGTKTISIYNGTISLGLISLFEEQKLHKLKVHNAIIRSCFYFVKYLLEAKTLEHLKLTSENYMMTPHPIVIMSDVISQLDHYELNLKYLAFTVDTCCKVRYELLRCLKKLEKLEIYYSVQGQTLNIQKLINITSSMKNVETTFIEYFDKNQVFSRAMFDASEGKSHYFKNMIESMDKYMEVRSVDYEQLRLETESTFLDN